MTKKKINQVKPTPTEEGISGSGSSFCYPEDVVKIGETIRVKDWYVRNGKMYVNDKNIDEYKIPRVFCVGDLENLPLSENVSKFTDALNYCGVIHAVN